MTYVDYEEGGSGGGDEFFEVGGGGYSGFTGFRAGGGHVSYCEVVDGVCCVVVVVLIHETIER